MSCKFHRDVAYEPEEQIADPHFFKPSPPPETKKQDHISKPMHPVLECRLGPRKDSQYRGWKPLPLERCRWLDNICKVPRSFPQMNYWCGQRRDLCSEWTCYLKPNREFPVEKCSQLRRLEICSRQQSCHQLIGTSHQLIGTKRRQRSLSLFCLVNVSLPSSSCHRVYLYTVINYILGLIRE